jgi:asparagine synthetase B (glutamine-hydrolysing)
MSGGLDSSSVAAVAAGVLGPAAPEALRAFTAVYETVADEERHYSSLVATGLNIGIDHLPLDGYTLFDRWDTGELPPEPTTEPMTATTADLLTRAADHGGSVLTGDGGDPLLLPSTLISQIGDVPFRRLMAGFWTSLRAQAPPPPIGVRSSLRRWLQPGATGVPAWLAEPLRQSFDARDRWVEITARRAADRGPRSGGREQPDRSVVAVDVRRLRSGATGRSVDMRYPFFDVRLVDVGLRLPSFPVLRQQAGAAKCHAREPPRRCCSASKTPLAVLPEAFHGGWSVSAAVQALAASPAIEQYVNIRKFEAVRSEFLFTDRAPGTLAAVCLAMWLRHSAAVAPTT